MTGVDFEDKIVEGVRIQRLAIDRQGKHRRVVPFGKMIELGLCNLSGHAFQRTEIDYPVDMTPAPLGYRVPECQNRFTPQILAQVLTGGLQ